jgi:hypothetical protein
MKPASARARAPMDEGASAPRSSKPRPFSIPEHAALRDLRRVLARGGLPAVDRRTPEDNARIAAFRTVEELLVVLDEFKRRVERGEPCRLVEREHPREAGRLVIELAIVVEPAEAERAGLPPALP